MCLMGTLGIVELQVFRNPTACGKHAEIATLFDDRLAVVNQTR